MSLAIRPATAPDIPVVRSLLAETWHATYDHLLGRETVTDITSRWHAEEVLAAEIGRSAHVFLVAEIDGRISATASANLGKSFEIDLRRLYVLPGYQGRGIGRALLAAVLGAFPAATAASLEVEPNNAPAIAFYRRAGFRSVARAFDDPGHTAAGVEHLRMLKKLTP